MNRILWRRTDGSTLDYCMFEFQEVTLISGEVIGDLAGMPGKVEFKVSPMRQRYTRLGVEQYLYESADSGYKAELTVDNYGIVQTYDGEWTSVTQG